MVRQQETTSPPTSLDGLVSRFGLVSRVGALPTAGFPGEYHFWKAEGGNTHRHGVSAGPELIGGGHVWGDPQRARFIAIAETAERYAGHDVLSEHRIRATADELSGECLEPERYPRCSPEEYARPGCPVVPFDPAAPIRWSSGLDLITREPVWVPSVMACYGVADVGPAERFAPRISTGFAVHTDPVEAVVRGMFEVIERDANAVLWLQRLPLPEIHSAHLTGDVVRLVEWCRLRFKEVRLFDATSDLGVPTAYCVISARHDRRARQMVGASCGRDIGAAAHKALLEALGSPLHIHSVPESDAADSPETMYAAGDTARYMGRAEHRHAFDFLLAASDDRPAPFVRPSLPDDPSEALARLLTRFADVGMRPVAVDRTPRELVDVGLTAVNVVIADLQPMALMPLAQFTAHPRLYEAPARMGYRVLPRESLNPWPQPMG
ncbi:MULTISPECIES: YcaO-like family protein [unclassified Streptomyces]|uniref:YcaO-like family protein n=1 Tax=unclassified Streptomyces TaxID=2593676 RepID=UPI0033B66DEB